MRSPRLWFKKEPMFLRIMRMFFVEEVPLGEVKYFMGGLRCLQLSEAEKALHTIVMSRNPGRDTLLLAECVAKMDRLTQRNQSLQSELARVKALRARPTGELPPMLREQAS